MTFIITMNNPAGELDRRTAKDERAEVLAAMVLECDELFDGDTFTVVEEDQS